MKPAIFLGIVGGLIGWVLFALLVVWVCKMMIG